MGVVLKITLCLTIVQTALADLETPNGVFKTNCFTDKNDEGCEHSRIKICHDFYACDLVVHFQSQIKRIGFIDDEILVAEGFNTYFIDDRKMEAKKIKKTIPPLNEHVDNKGNKYYSGEGTTYISHKESGKEIEIITTGEYSFNQLALDKEANLLFILTFASRNKERREGKLYGVVLDPLNIVDDKIQAEAVEGEYNITALAVAGSLERLLLGIRTENGGKLVRLARQMEDPCVVLKSPQNEIINVIKSTEKKLLQIFEENLININVRNSYAEKQKEDIKHLEEQNGRCEVQLKESISSAALFRASINSYSESLSTYNSFLLESDSSQLEISSVKNNNSDHEYLHEKECLYVEDVKFMRDRITQLENKEKELIERLKKYNTDLNDILRVRADLRFGEEENNDADLITFRENPVNAPSFITRK